MPRLHPEVQCPHCGEKKLRAIKDEHGRGYYMECLHCEARGPIRKTAKLALGAWNERVEIKTKPKKTNTIHLDYMLVADDLFKRRRSLQREIQTLSRRLRDAPGPAETRDIDLQIIKRDFALDQLSDVRNYLDSCIMKEE